MSSPDGTSCFGIQIWLRYGDEASKLTFQGIEQTGNGTAVESCIEQVTLTKLIIGLVFGRSRKDDPSYRYLTPAKVVYLRPVSRTLGHGS
ncbi:hypothetical protein Moror_7803 [Moniliophthora roreri MCA 2997]|uniref:Uncharacterized protein n=1 Tax=Moniliophthora roreri (strain MCA 2997) TaxID=1381753 RepID=V2WTI6_MONRO|nr:hypothetical protein Moror_7803 [Moniliophthora roreri MCA 2997]KAI3616202.1 hypothetical protein WG66_014110 [Moniliophthora roreri]